MKALIYNRTGGPAKNKNNKEDALRKELLPIIGKPGLLPAEALAAGQRDDDCGADDDEDGSDDVADDGEE